MAWKPEMTDRSTFLGKKKKNYQSDQFKSYLLCPPKTKVHCRKGGQTQGKIRNQIPRGLLSNYAGVLHSNPKNYSDGNKAQDFSGIISKILFNYPIQTTKKNQVNRNLDDFLSFKERIKLSVILFSSQFERKKLPRMRDSCSNEGALERDWKKNCRRR